MKLSSGVAIICICLILTCLTGIVTADPATNDKYVSISMNIDNGKITTTSAEVSYGSAPNFFPSQEGFRGELVAADGSVVKTFTVWDPRVQFGDGIVSNPDDPRIQNSVDRQDSADFVVTIPFDRSVTGFRLYTPAGDTLLASVDLKPPIESFFASYPHDPDNPAISGPGSPVIADTPLTGTPGPDTASSGQLPGIMAIGSGAVLLLGGGFASVRFLRKKPRSVLIVDDNPDLLEVVAGMLRTGGYVARTATSGEACLKELESAVPDLILLDIGMEPMNGWETLRQIKKNPATRRILVIMLTAWKLTPQDVEDYGICIEDYIMKPVTYENLKESIMHVFARRELIDEKIAAAKGTGIDRNELCECARLIRVVDVNKRLWDILVRSYNLDERMNGPGNEIPPAIKNTERKIRDQEQRLKQILHKFGSGVTG